MKKGLTFVFIFFSFITAGCSHNIPSSRQHFIDQTNSKLPPKDKIITKALLGDINNSGDYGMLLLTDSAIKNEQIKFLSNKGNGKYENNTNLSLPDIDKKIRDIKLVDVNGDESLDIILLGDDPDKGIASTTGQRVDAEGKRDYLLINSPQNRFADETPSRLPYIGNGYQDIQAGDIDNDKDLDLLITGENVPSLVFINKGNGIFIDETISRIETLSKGVKKGVFADFDGDSDLDLFFAIANNSNALMVNNGNGKFDNLTDNTLPKIVANSQDAAAGDIDGDGDIDIVVAVNEIEEENKNKETNAEKKHMEMYEPFVNANLEQGSFASAWTTTGDAWRIWSSQDNINENRSKPLPEAGIFYAASYKKAPKPEEINVSESATGTIRSKNFRIPFNAKKMTFLKTGWDGQFGNGNKNFFYLRNALNPTDHKFEQYKIAPPSSDTWVLEEWDIANIVGEEVYFEAVDDNNNSSYASIGFDALKLSDKSEEGDRWEKKESYILQNDGSGNFKDISLGISVSNKSYGVRLFDIDNDNDLDIFIYGIYGITLLVNDGKGEYRDETYARMQNPEGNIEWIDGGDIDNDGDIDIITVQDGIVKVLSNQTNPKIILENIQKLKEILTRLPQKDFMLGRLEAMISDLGDKGGLIDIATEAEVAQSKETQKRFYGALKTKLEQNFKEVSNGCADTGKPDENDWITSCSSQSAILSVVLDTLEILKSLNNSEKVSSHPIIESDE